jgi:probable F420-dependent oxidoreductase
LSKRAFPDSFRKENNCSRLGARSESILEDFFIMVTDKTEMGLVRFGVNTFPTDYGPSIPGLAKAVEERGFDSLFFNEHTHIPVNRRTAFPGGGELPLEYTHTLDLFVALSAAACATTRITLGTGICLIVERDPILLAKEIASLDHISNGRVVLGIGAGWNAEEMADHGTAFKQRWAILRERVLAIREIWSRDAAEYHGEFVNFDPLWSWPKPVQKPGPKILLGSKSRRSFDRLIEYCDGWMPIGTPGKEPELADGLNELRRRCEAAGRSFDSLELAVIGLPPDRDAALRHLEIGFKHLIFTLPAADRDVSMRALDQCAAIASSLRASIS